MSSNIGQGKVQRLLILLPLPWRPPRSTETEWRPPGSTTQSSEGADQVERSSTAPFPETGNDERDHCSSPVVDTGYDDMTICQSPFHDCGAEAPVEVQERRLTHKEEPQLKPGYPSTGKWTEDTCESFFQLL